MACSLHRVVWECFQWFSLWPNIGITGVIPREIDLIGLGYGLDKGISSILKQVVTALSFEKMVVNCDYLRNILPNNSLPSTFNSSAK